MVESSKPYKGEHCVEKALQTEREKNGTQPGDPEKAAQAIFDVVAGKRLKDASVLRLPLGQDAWEAGIGQMDKVKKDFEECKGIAYEMGFD